jgi:glycerophosphoryl diester phosphodiesterase
MDYLVELAEVPEVVDAIRLVTEQANGGGTWAGHAVTPEHAARARRLQLYDFLRQEHPQAWKAEVVHAFYGEEAFAALVWTNLRYCEPCRRHIAAYVLRDQHRKPTKRQLPVSDPDPAPFARTYASDRSAAIDGYAAALNEKPGVIDTLCAEKPELVPDPPVFLRTLLEADGTPPEDYDRRTRELLTDRAQVCRRAGEKQIPVPFNMVLHQELNQIQTTRADARGSDHPTPVSEREAPLRRALRMNLLGLAFSGGGIRSATFNLGVLQSLSKIGLLRQCDYLSTVSGGGYIGSWLAAWIRRESMAAQAGGVMVEMQRRLSPVRTPDPMDERVRPIRFLREYSNYLTPRTGFFSADTWTMFGIYLRNALLNQVIIVSLFGALLLTPRLAFSLTSLGQVRIWLPWVFWVIGAIVLLANLVQLKPPHGTPLKAPTHDGKDRGWVSRSQRHLSTVTQDLEPAINRVLKWMARPIVVQLGVVLPWTLAAAMAAAYFSYRSRGGELGATTGFLSAGAGLTVLTSLLILLVAGRADRCWAEKEKSKAYLVFLLAAVVSGLVASGLAWVLLTVLVAMGRYDNSLSWHALALGTGGLLSVLSLSIVVMLGMLGDKFPDEHREWWSKLRTFIHVWAVGWLVLFLVALYVPWGVHWLQERDLSLTTGLTALAGWVASTVFGVHKGRTAEDDRKKAHESGGRAPWSASVLHRAAQAAPFVFILGLVLGLAIAIDQVLLALGEGVKDRITFNEYWTLATWSATGTRPPSENAFTLAQSIDWWWTPTIASALLGIGFLFSWRVDINDFSLHHFYKNRLVRCYLGASRARDRRADWFTGFDPTDDVRLKEFDHDVVQTPRYPGPYPILNCALNLVAGEDLAWQERKATSFVFTPKYCGYDVDRAVLRKVPNGLREDAYVPTKDYYRPGYGPLLGMAMAISGAAANPNMGRASSPAMAFLMTVFNVRLGWWMGNPRRAGAMRPSPRLGLPHTALELFGGTDDRKKYVNVSDGGHFENLGVYELIRRGCRYIVVCDAGQDGRFLAEDLGNLVRQCRTDFGVEIDIDIDRIRERTNQSLSQTHCVVGRIRYLQIPKRVGDTLVAEDDKPLLRGSRPAHEDGYLVYLKPSVTGDEAQDVLEYFRRIPEFPHQTTADQWFDESQFESYRKLGMHVAEEAFSRYQDDDAKPLADLSKLFPRLYAHWYRPSLVINQHSTDHVQEYSRIMELIRSKPELRHLDHTMFERLPDTGVSASPRDEFHICNALIQLIENVYADLDLEHLWNHPHVQGWMRVFEQWAQQPAFRRTWRISEPTYAERFRNFYNDRLRGRALALPRHFVASQRGRGNGHPENTLDAFDSAIEQGASVIEFDVRKLACDALVLWHDDQVNGTPIQAMTLAALQKNARHVVTFDACARELHGRVQLAIELKDRNIEKDVLDVLRGEGRHRWRRRDFVLTSVHRSVIAGVQQLDQSVRTGLLLRDAAPFVDALGRFPDLGADFLAPAHSLVTERRLRKAAREGVPLVPWSDSNSIPDAEQRKDNERHLALMLRHDVVAGVIVDDVAQAVSVKSAL